MNKTSCFSSFLFSVILMGSLSAGAAPVALQGTFAFQGHVQMMGRKTVDVVDVRMSGAAQRLAQLRQGGANCSLVNSQTYRCLTLSREFDPLAAVILSQRNQGLAVAFGAMTGVPSLVSQGTDLVEWEIPQQFRWNRGAGEKYRYLELRGGLVKIVLPGQPDLWLNLSREGLRRFDSVTTTVDRWRFFEDYGEVILQPVGRR